MVVTWKYDDVNARQIFELYGVISELGGWYIGRLRGGGYIHIYSYHHGMILRRSVLQIMVWRM